MIAWASSLGACNSCANTCRREKALHLKSKINKKMNIRHSQYSTAPSTELALGHWLGKEYLRLEF